MKQVNSSTNLAMADSMLQTGHVVKDKWQVIEKIGQGAFGEVYKCKDFTSNRQVALKLVSKERVTSATTLLKLEATVLKELQGKNYFPKFVRFGKTERFDYLVMELLGPSLSELKKQQPERKFSLSTTLRLGYMMLKCIHSIHKAGYLHRDIKPSNFTIGIGEENRRKVYLLDFGLSRQYVLENGEVRPPRYKVSFHGTPRYASLRVLQGKEAGRQDDLMSLFYALSEFSFKDLPWKNIRDYREMAQAKEAFNHQLLVREFPDEFQEFYNHINELTFFDKPDYELLYSVFDRCIKRRGVKDTDPFDFEEDGNQQITRQDNTSSAHSKSSSDVLIIGCSSYEEDLQKQKEKEQIKRSKSTSNNLHHLLAAPGDEGVRKDNLLLRSKSSNNMMVNKKNTNNYYNNNNSKDTGFSASPFNTNSHCQPSISISTEPDFPIKIPPRNLNTGEVKNKLKSQSSVESNKLCLSQQTESLFMDSLSRENFSFDTSKADNSQLRRSLSLNRFLRKDSNRSSCVTSLSVLRGYKDKGAKQKTRHSVRRSVSHPTSIPSHLLIKSIFFDPRAHAQQGLPRCWSCPTISLFIRSDLKPPLKQQASFDENVYEVDVMRNVAAKQLNEDPVHVDCRRNSLPFIHTPKTSIKEHPVTCQENKEQYQNKISKSESPNISTAQRESLKNNIVSKTFCYAQQDQLKNHISEEVENSLSTRDNFTKVQKSLSDSNVSERNVINNRKMKYDPQIKKVMFHSNPTMPEKNTSNESIKVSSFTENQSEDYYNTNKNISNLKFQSVSKNNQLKFESDKCCALNINVYDPFKFTNIEEDDKVSKGEYSGLKNNCDIKNSELPTCNNLKEVSVISHPENGTSENEIIHLSQFVNDRENVSQGPAPAHDSDKFCSSNGIILQTVKNQERDSLAELRKDIFSKIAEVCGNHAVERINMPAINKSQSENNISRFSKENIQNEILANKTIETQENESVSEARDKAPESSLEKVIDSYEEKQIRRRHRANAENKYVKDESELQLHFTRRRPRPSSVILEDQTYQEDSEEFESSKISSYLSVHSLGEKAYSGIYSAQIGSMSSDLLQPPPGEPPSGYILPSRRMRYRRAVTSLTRVS